jgi:hypothetical protein
MYYNNYMGFENMGHGREKSEDEIRRDLMDTLRGLGASEEEIRDIMYLIDLEKRITKQMEQGGMEGRHETEKFVLQSYRDWLAWVLKEYRKKGEEGKETAQKELVIQQGTLIYKAAKNMHLGKRNRRLKVDDINKETNS